jgi:hypothetical protein
VEIWVIEKWSQMESKERGEGKWGNADFIF